MTIRPKLLLIFGMELITGGEFLAKTKRNSLSETQIHHDGTPWQSIASVESFHGDKLMVENFNKWLKVSTNC